LITLVTLVLLFATKLNMLWLVIRRSHCGARLILPLRLDAEKTFCGNPVTGK
jgi:hypothetical protein